MQNEFEEFGFAGMTMNPEEEELRKKKVLENLQPGTSVYYELHMIHLQNQLPYLNTLEEKQENLKKQEQILADERMKQVCPNSSVNELEIRFKVQQAAFLENYDVLLKDMIGRIQQYRPARELGARNQISGASPSCSSLSSIDEPTRIKEERWSSNFNLYLMNILATLCAGENASKESLENVRSVLGGESNHEVLQTRYLAYTKNAHESLKRLLEYSSDESVHLIPHVEYLLSHLMMQHQNAYKSTLEMFSSCLKRTFLDRCSKQQLSFLLSKHPDLINYTSFVFAHLRNELPIPQNNKLFDTDLIQREEYIQKFSKALENLPPYYDYLRAACLYWRITLEQEKNPPRLYQNSCSLLNLYLAYIDLMFLPTEMAHPYKKTEKSSSIIRLDFIYPSNVQNFDTCGLRIPSQDDVTKLFSSMIMEIFSMQDTQLVSSISQRIFARVGETYVMALLEELGLVTMKTTLSKRRFEFCTFNRQYYSSKDSINVWLNVQNLTNPNLTINVYGLNAENILKQGIREISADIDLDGITPNICSRVLNLETIPSWKVNRVNIPIPELDSRPKRAYYIVEVIGDEYSLRSLIHCGDVVIRKTFNAIGTNIEVFDVETQELIPSSKVSLWIQGRTFVASMDNQGKLLLPLEAYGNIVITVNEQDGTSYSKMDYIEQEAYGNFKLYGNIFLDQEQLLAQNRNAQVFIRPVLENQGIRVPLGLLEDLKLVISSTNEDGVNSTQILPLSKQDIKTAATIMKSFAVIPYLRSISVSLQGMVITSKENLNDAISMNVNGSDNENEKKFIYISAGSCGELFVKILGKGGEFYKNQPIQITFYHKYLEEFDLSFTTNEEGFVCLESNALVNIHKIEVKNHRFKCEYELKTSQKCARNDFYIIKPGEGLRIPVSLFKKNILHSWDYAFVKNKSEPVSEFLKLENSQFVISKNLPVGDYHLYLGPNLSNRFEHIESIKIQCIPQSGVLSSGLEWKSSLSIVSVLRNMKYVTIQLSNDSFENVRVHVLFRHFIDRDNNNWFKKNDDSDSINPKMTYFTYPSSKYGSERMLGDELLYVSRRKLLLESALPGNMLSRPSELIQPYELRATKTQSVQGRPGAPPAPAAGAAAGFGNRAYRKGCMDSADMQMKCYSMMPGSTVIKQPELNIDFLPVPSQFICNLVPDKQGQVRINLEELPSWTRLNQFYLQVIAVDDQGGCCEHNLYGCNDEQIEKQDPPHYQDIRHSFLSKEHMFETRRVYELRRDQKHNIGDASSAELCVIDTVPTLFGIFSSLIDGLESLSFLWKWPSLSHTEKLKMCDLYGGHELFFFIHQRDRKWFDEHIKPVLQYKKEKSLIDLFLIDGGKVVDQKYTTLAAIENMNVVEKCLLICMMKDEDPLFRKRICESIENEINPDIQESLSTKFFDSALQAGVSKTKGNVSAINQFGASETMAMDVDDNDSIILEKMLNRNVLDETYKDAGPVKVYKEKYYHFNSSSRLEIKSSSFWACYARHILLLSEEKNPPMLFLSSEVQSPTSIGESIFMLGALTGLDFERNEDHDWLHDDKGNLILSPSNGTILIQKQLEKVELNNSYEDTVMLGQTFITTSSNKKVKDQFLMRETYGLRNTVTNISDQDLHVRISIQIPNGSCPIERGRRILLRNAEIRPFCAWTETIEFYFPYPGQYELYPIHVTLEDSTLIGYGTTQVCEVVQELQSIDETSWDDVSSQGSLEQVMMYLQGIKDLTKFYDINKVFWRIQENSKEFYDAIISFYEDRMVFNESLWMFSVQYKDLPRIQALLRRRLLKSFEFGPYFNGGNILKIDHYEENPECLNQQKRLVELFPIINARVHPFSNVAPNQDVVKNWQMLVKDLYYRTSKDLNEKVLLSVCIGLLGFDRFHDARKVFNYMESLLERRRQASNDLEMMQMDYLRCYLLFFELPQGPRKACEIARKYVDSCEVSKFWKKKFGEILEQALGELEPIRVGEKFSNNQAGMVAPTISFRSIPNQNSLEFTISGIHSSNTIYVNIYEVDLELLFSTNPFGTRIGTENESSLGRFGYIQPNKTCTINSSNKSMQLPNDVAKRNIMVEARLGTVSCTRMIFSNSLNLTFIENFGQVKVSIDQDQPLPKAYVKVFARMKNQVMFWKDGYTDFRGRFDYASLNTGLIDKVEKFAVFVSSKDHGSSIHECLPPFMT